MDFDLFWRGLTQGSNWVLSVGLVGIVAVLVWLAQQFLVVLAEETQGWFRGQFEAFRRRARARADARLAEAVQRAEDERVAAIAAERVGRRFLYRRSADHAGQECEVVRLGPIRLDYVVTLRWSNPPDRVQEEGDREDGHETEAEWADVTKPYADQRYTTSKYELKSNDPADGYLFWEEIVGDQVGS